MRFKIISAITMLFGLASGAVSAEDPLTISCKKIDHDGPSHITLLASDTTPGLYNVSYDFLQGSITEDWRKTGNLAGLACEFFSDSSDVIIGAMCTVGNYAYAFSTKKSYDFGYDNSQVFSEKISHNIALKIRGGWTTTSGGFESIQCDFL
jgi:hypothetical protein